ncbi:ATP-binding protein [Ramlibacter sp. H39-3-26]|uniref:ATP-binding protein n=1 Tax=Curvibacter soli TaxID=3031331 RepID=UPI0023DAE5A4|nr:ATP-binding protein [Ramlibacter sp. H39-3-26]MDF1484907.1 ATP-binding protein [Ramlibacter sp. H39-3-26]
MRLTPRTLLGRNVLLIVVLVALGQAAGAVLVRQLLLKPRLEQMADGLARTAGALRAGMAALPPAARADFVRRFNAQAPQAAGPATARGGLLPPLSPLERSMVRSVSRRLAGQDADIVWRREAGGGLALRIAMDGADYWIALPGLLPAREATGAWLGASLAGALLALAGALLIQRRINRPLARLADAAHRLAGGAAPDPLPEDGPAEIATVGRSFNHLARSLQDAERERALMLAGISHDLRTPLTKLRLGVEILREPAGPELAASMERGIAEMDAIVGQFLDFARSGAEEAPAPASLAALAAEVAAACGAQGRAVALQAGPTPAAPLRTQLLRRALVNLVENAWRHGQPPVTLRTGADAECLWVEVEDHGAGIAPEDAQRLKQPFHGNARKGTGLGLAIVERVARAHGGRLDLLRGTSGGLRARITLPLRNSH